MSEASHPESVQKPLRTLSEALGKALATDPETIVNVMENAFEANPTLALHEEVKLGFKIGAELGRHSGISPRAAHLLAKLAASPTISEAIKRTREALELSQYQLADRLGVTQPAVSDWEGGTRSISPRNLGALIRLAKSKGIDVTNPEKPAPRIKGNSLRRLRLSMRKSHAEMGELLGLSEESIKIYEGRQHPPAATERKLEALRAGDTATAAKPFRHVSAAAAA
jgi:transcriptional regulator with XRE-family HTH domain